MRTILVKAFSPKYLLVTNIALSTGLSALGDIIEQRYEIFIDHIHKWDPIRTRNMAATGVSAGLITHWWYNILERKVPGNTIQVVLKKVMLDQFICSPISIASFFMTLAILEQSDMHTVVIEIKQKAWRLYAAEWVIWPPAQFINFYVMPHRFRVLYDSTISLFYDIYTSYVKNKLPLDTD
ncbi:mpv17-like protein 2 [Atheta coriaria]|uniref:mpv17-like protein 2 n=1 Tax=Dalotia coriaria TaxID=877792 RepID=UPI0031F46F6B